MSTVTVQLGARWHKATVIEERNGRIYVDIHIPGAEVTVRSSYLPWEVIWGGDSNHVES